MLVLIFRTTLIFFFLLGEHYQIDGFVDVTEQVAAPGDTAPGTLEVLNSHPTV